MLLDVPVLAPVELEFLHVVFDDVLEVGLEASGELFFGVWVFDCLLDWCVRSRIVDIQPQRF